jgi:hypothetical protein
VSDRSRGAKKATGLVAVVVAAVVAAVLGHEGYGTIEVESQ